MELADIIKITATLLAKDSILTEIAQIEENPSQTKSEELELFIKLANLAVREVAEEYSPTIHIEKLGSDTECRILLSNFSKTFQRAIWILDLNGIKQTFWTYLSYLKLPKNNRMFEICYQYIPDDASLFEDVDVNSEISDRILALKVASSFCLVNLMFDESSVWDRKFVQAIKTALIQTKERKFFKNNLF